MNRKCVSCGCDTVDFFLRSTPTEFRPAVDLNRCPRCRLIFRASFQDEFDASLYDYYASNLGLPLEQVYDPINTVRMREILQGLHSLLVPAVDVPDFLDVGCGDGHFVYVACSMGWHGLGIDLSESAIEVGRAFGVPLEARSFFDQSIPPDSCDLVMMSEFIEHVPSPDSILKRAETVVRPGGLVHVMTPNFSSLDRRVAGGKWKTIHPEHYFYFTPETLRDLVSRHTNFEIVNLETRNFSPALLIASLREFAGRVSSGAPGGGLQPGCNTGLPIDRNLRCMGNGAWLFRTAKRLANSGLNALGMGATIAVTLRRPLQPEKGPLTHRRCGSGVTGTR